MVGHCLYLLDIWVKELIIYQLIKRICSTQPFGSQTLRSIWGRVHLFEWLWMKHISLFHSVLNRAHKTVSLPRLAMLSAHCFSLEQETSPHSRYMIWQICYVERATTVRITINHHVFLAVGIIKKTTKMKSSLRARGSPGVSGALRSLRIVRIGRIGSAFELPVIPMYGVLEVGRYAVSIFYILAFRVPALFCAYRHFWHVAGTQSKIVRVWVIRLYDPIYD